MPPEKNQVKFRCSDRFLQRIKSECIKREMTVQDLVTGALRIYFQSPDEWNMADLAFITFDEDAKSEQHDWVGLWVKYFSKMPREKVLLMVEVMKLDLLHYGSSRRKAALRKRQQTGKESTHVEARTE
jgi:hypothetical protein